MGSIWEWDFLSKQEERHPIQLFIWSCLKEHLHLFHLWPIFQSTQQLSDKDAHWIFRIEYTVSGPNQLQKTLQSEQISAFQTSFLFQYLISLFSFIWIILQFAPAPQFFGKKKKKKSSNSLEDFQPFLWRDRNTYRSVPIAKCVAATTEQLMSREYFLSTLKRQYWWFPNFFDFQRSNTFFSGLLWTKSALTAYIKTFTGIMIESYNYSKFSCSQLCSQPEHTPANSIWTDGNYTVLREPRIFRLGFRKSL